MKSNEKNAPYLANTRGAGYRKKQQRGTESSQRAERSKSKEEEGTGRKNSGEMVQKEGGKVLKRE